MTERSFGAISAAIVGLLALGLGGCSCGGPPPGGCESNPCFRAYECVEMCGGPVVYTGCCPCETGTIDRVTECVTDSGPGSDSTTSDAASDATTSDMSVDASDSATADSTVMSDAGLLGLGEPCTAPGQCASGVCTELIFGTGEIRCTAMCDAGNPTCPPGGVCYVPGAFAGICLATCDPVLMDCPMGLSCIATGFMPPDDYGCYQ